MIWVWLFRVPVVYSSCSFTMSWMSLTSDVLSVHSAYAPIQPFCRTCVAVTHSTRWCSSVPVSAVQSVCMLCIVLTRISATAAPASCSVIASAEHFETSGCVVWWFSVGCVPVTAWVRQCIVFARYIFVWVQCSVATSLQSVTWTSSPFWCVHGRGHCTGSWWIIAKLTFPHSFDICSSDTRFLQSLWRFVVCKTPLCCWVCWVPTRVLLLVPSSILRASQASQSEWRFSGCLSEEGCWRAPAPSSASPLPSLVTCCPSLECSGPFQDIGIASVPRWRPPALTMLLPSICWLLPRPFGSWHTLPPTCPSLGLYFISLIGADAADADATQPSYAFGLLPDRVIVLELWFTGWFDWSLPFDPGAEYGVHGFRRPEFWFGQVVSSWLIRSRLTWRISCGPKGHFIWRGCLVV